MRYLFLVITFIGLSACTSEAPGQLPNTEAQLAVSVENSRWTYADIQEGKLWLIDKDNQLHTAELSKTIGNQPTKMNPQLNSSYPKSSSVAGANGYVCVLNNENLSTLYCMGTNTILQINSPLQFSLWGNNPAAKSLQIENIHRIEASDTALFLVTKDGKLYAWGSESLTDKAGKLHDIPTQISFPEDKVRLVALGEKHGCVLSERSNLYCFGANESQQTNAKLKISNVFPMEYVGINVIESVGLGLEHTCMADRDNTLYCQGNNQYGQLGNKTASPSNSPQRIAEHFSSVVAGKNHTCALNVIDNLVYCFGQNDKGQCGISSANLVLEPTSINSSLNFKGLIAKGNYTCAITNDDEIVCWGGD